MQRELLPGVSGILGWYYSRTYNTWATLNNAVDFNSYTPIAITNPISNQPLTVFNLNSAFQGKVQNFVKDFRHQPSGLQRIRDERSGATRTWRDVARGLGDGTQPDGYLRHDQPECSDLLRSDRAAASGARRGQYSLPAEFKLAANYPLPWESSRAFRCWPHLVRR